MLDFREWLTNYLKYRRGIGIGRTIAPNQVFLQEWPCYATPPQYTYYYTGYCLSLSTGTSSLLKNRTYWGDQFVTKQALSLQLKNHELFHLTACVSAARHILWMRYPQNEQTALMPEMASSAKSKVFRVTGLPVGKAEPYVQSILVQTIRDILSNDEQQRLEVRVACVPSCDGSQTLSALVE